MCACYPTAGLHRLNLMQPEPVLRHLRYALRALRKAPLYTATVVLTLALGIGANSAVFSAIDAVLLRPLPFPDAGQLVRLAQFNPRQPQSIFVAPVRQEDWNRLNHTFQAISGYYAQDDTELSGDLPEKLKHAFVAPRFLQVWGVAPQLGRDFSPAEEHFGGPEAALISDRLWRRRFHADPGVLRKALRLGRSSVPIVGVLPASFLYPDRDVDVWSPSPADAPFAHGRELTWYTVIGRMRPGVNLAQARADLAAVQADLGRQYPKTDAQLGVAVNPLKELTVGGVRGSLWVLFGSVTLLLLIACGNIAALLLVRTAARRQEIAVRVSLGASRASILAQLLAETMVLAVAGAGLGLLLAGMAVRALRSVATGLPRVEEIALDWRVVLYSLVCALAATFLCGLWPAVRAGRGDPAVSLAQAGRSHVSGRNGTQFVLVGMEIALAVTLLAGAGLLVRGFEALAHISPGFDPAHVLTFHISTSWAETNDHSAAKQRVERLLDGLRAVPGVEAAAISAWLPGMPTDYEVEVKTAEGRAETAPKMIAQARFVSPGYFAALGIPLLAGAICRDDLNYATAMVNRSFADEYLGGTGALGRHVLDPSNAYIPAAAIAGISGDAREMGLDRAPVPTVYWCFGGLQPGTYFVVRTHGDPSAMAQAVRRKMHELEPMRSVYDLTPLAGHISDAYAQSRLRTILLSFFALTAIALAAMGLYGTLSYLLQLRRREVGLRLALGAERVDIVRQFVRRGLSVCAVGAAAGLALAAASSRLLAGMLYGVSPFDGITLAGVAALVFAVALAASLIPALRAARLDPVAVLREE